MQFDQISSNIRQHRGSLRYRQQIWGRFEVLAMLWRGPGHALERLRRGYRCFDEHPGGISWAGPGNNWLCSSFVLCQCFLFFHCLFFWIQFSYFIVYIVYISIGSYHFIAVRAPNYFLFACRTISVHISPWGGTLLEPFFGLSLY